MTRVSLLVVPACAVRPGDAAPAPAPASEPATASDVVWLAEDIVTIGRPRGQLGRDDPAGAIAARADRRLLVADHDG